MHAVLPVVAVKVPDPHCVAAVAPGPVAYEPAGAFVHEARPAVEVKVPAGHKSDAVAPLPET